MEQANATAAQQYSVKLSRDQGFSFPFNLAAAKSAIEERRRRVQIKLRCISRRIYQTLAIERVSDFLYFRDVLDDFDMGSVLCRVLMLLDVILFV